MNLICEITQQALLTGYLTLDSENQLRQLLSRDYGTEDFKAFIHLQQAVMEGFVRQESRERFFPDYPQEAVSRRSRSLLDKSQIL